MTMTMTPEVIEKKIDLAVTVNDAAPCSLDLCNISLSGYQEICAFLGKP